MLSFKLNLCHFAILAILCCKIESSKVLIVFPFPAHSHFSLGISLANALVDKGHEVTMINPYPDKTQQKIHDVSVDDLIPFVDEMKKQLFEFGNQKMFAAMQNFFTMGHDLTRKVLENPNVQKLMQSNEHFDVVIIESFINDALIGFGYHFKAPVILLSPGDITMCKHFVANPTPVSYVPNKLGTLTSHMNFWQRLQNCLAQNMFNIATHIFMQPSHKRLFEEFFTKDVPFDDVAYNISLVLTNSHISVTNPMPHQPNAIEIGGFHVLPPKKLPENLQKFMDNAKEGVILFSMGSNLKSADLKPETRNALLRAFSKIKQQVLWKFEADLDDLPKNVKIMKWLPQNDILAHPNVRAFISHGGLLSTIETIYHGVPIIGVPVFGDQKSNVASAVENGYALGISLDELNEENLSKALNEIINNPKYRKNAKRRSSLMHDRPLKPIDMAVYWVEYVIRHQGAPELRSAALDLKWYQLYMIDVSLFIYVIAVVVCIGLKKLYKLLLGSKSKNVPKSKKNKNKRE